MDRNYVTVTLCIWHKASRTEGGWGIKAGVTERVY